VDEILADFLLETTELLAAAESGLVALDGNRADRSPVDAIFRAAHTIKGNSAFLEFYALADVTHALEDLLHGLRNGRLALDDRLMEGLFAGFDATKGLFERIRAGEKPAEAPPT
jgi:two-component system chemotaxis sensor kinase CheA